MFCLYFKASTKEALHNSHHHLPFLVSESSEIGANRRITGYCLKC